MKYRFVVMCEDIRNEMGGKVSLMGVLGAKLLVPSFPFYLPKLCFFVDWGEFSGKITVEMDIIPPAGVVAPKLGRGVELRGQTGMTSRSLIAMNNFAFQVPGEYTFAFSCNNEPAGSETLVVEKFEAPEAMN